MGDRTPRKSWAKSYNEQDTLSPILPLSNNDSGTAETLQSPIGTQQKNATSLNGILIVV